MTKYIFIEQAPKQYGCLAFLFVVFMCLITAAIFGGFPVWLIWIFVREMRKARR